MVTTPLSHPHISTTKHLPTLTVTLHYISSMVISIFATKIWFWDLTSTEVRKVGFWKIICIARRTLRRLVASGWFFGMMECGCRTDDIWWVMLRNAVVCGERWVWRSEDGADFHMAVSCRETSMRGDSLQQLSHTNSDHFYSPSVSLPLIPHIVPNLQILKESPLAPTTHLHKNSHTPPPASSPSSNSHTEMPITFIPSPLGTTHFYRIYTFIRFWKILNSSSSKFS